MAGLRRISSITSMMRRIGTPALAPLLAAFAALVYSAPAADTPFYTKGEAREAVLVQAMRAEGNYVLPLRNGNEIPSKPPLFHWLAAAAATIDGEVSELSTRAPSVVAAALAVGATAWLGVRMFTATAACVAAMVLGSSVTFFVSATSARVDMVLAAAITIALAAFYADCSGPRRGLGHGFHAAVAAAVLAKGPVGFVLPWLVIAVFLAVTRDREYVQLLRPFRAAGWLVLPAAWYVAAYALAGDAFLAKQLVQENFQRVLDAEAGATGHVKPFYAHLPLLLGGFAPWSLMWLAAGARGSRECFNVRSRSLLFLLIWIAAPLVLLSLAGSKRAVYMLPSYPACALLVAWWWTQPQGWTQDAIDRGERTWRAIARATAALLAVALGVLFLQGLGLPLDRAIAPLLSDGDRANLAAIVESSQGVRGALVTGAFLGLTAVAAFALAVSRGRRDLAAAVIGVFAAAAIAAGGMTLQRTLASTQSVKSFVEAVRARADGDASWAFFRDVSYPVAFYARRAVPRVDALDVLPVERPVVVFTFAERAADLVAASGASGRVAIEQARFTFGDNPVRDPLLVFVVSQPSAVGSPDTGGYGPDVPGAVDP
jgi:4-amino-4-deoxy-L-arabinose transferase-like glycosyltransferase